MKGYCFHEIKGYSFSGRIFGVIHLFLENRVMKAVLNRVASSSFHFNAEVSHGSFLGACAVSDLLQLPPHVQLPTDLLLAETFQNLNIA